MTTVPKDRLAVFDLTRLGRRWGDDVSAMAAAAWLAGEPPSHEPKCVDPAICRLVNRLGDRRDDEQRQMLKPLVVRAIGTGDDGKQAQRHLIAMRHAVHVVFPLWLERAGEVERARALRALPMGSQADIDASLGVLLDVCNAMSALNEDRAEERHQALLAELNRRGYDDDDADAVADAAGVVIYEVAGEVTDDAIEAVDAIEATDAPALHAAMAVAAAKAEAGLAAIADAIAEADVDFTVAEVAEAIEDAASEAIEDDEDDDALAEALALAGVEVIEHDSIDGGFACYAAVIAATDADVAVEAATIADAVADVVADADADASETSRWWKVRDAAGKALYEHYDKRFAEWSEEANARALRLLDELIEAP